MAEYRPALTPAGQTEATAHLPSGMSVEQVGDIVLRVETVKLGALDQGVDRSGAAAAGIGAGKQIILPANGNRPVILPISGRRSRFITAGTHSMGAAFAASMSSGAPAAMSFMSR